MYRKEIITILKLVKENGLKLDIAADEICDLVSVMKGEADTLPDDDHVKLENNGFGAMEAAIEKAKGNVS